MPAFRIIEAFDVVEHVSLGLVARAIRLARCALATWIEDYNTVRPHSSLGNPPLAAYARLSASEMQRDGALRYIEGFAPRPVASPSHQGSNEAKRNSQLSAG